MTAFIPVQLGILDPLYNLFGWILSTLYNWIGNYGMVVIIFTIIIRAILIPFGLKSQKSMLKQQMLLPEVNEIKRKTKDPRQQQELMQELYKKNGVSMFSGCLPSLIPLIIIWPLIYIFRSPLRWIGQVPLSNLQKIADLLIKNGDISGAFRHNVASMDLDILQALRNSASTLSTAVENGWISLKQVINTNFLGMDLSRTPSWNPKDWFGPESYIWLPLLLLVIITCATYFLQMWLTRQSTPRKSRSKEDKERDEKNPAKKGQMSDDKMPGMGKSMMIFMPLFMLYTMFTFPAAMCLYWLFQNIMYLFQSYLGYKFYVKPLRQALEQEKTDFINSRRRRGKNEA